MGFQGATAYLKLHHFLSFFSVPHYMSHIFRTFATKLQWRMTEGQFIELTRKGEGNQIEYKTCTEEVSESLYESVCSMLNHTGGSILMGVTDDGDIEGVNPDRAETLKKNIINCI